jgi:hypothetical protein
MLASYHNTVDVPRVESEARARRAKTQEADCLFWLRSHPDRSFSAEEVWQAVRPHAPLQSIRRALTNLKTAGKVEWTGETVKGMWAHRINCWRVAQPAPFIQERLL